MGQLPKKRKNHQSLTDGEIFPVSPAPGDAALAGAGLDEFQRFLPSPATLGFPESQAGTGRNILLPTLPLQPSPASNPPLQELQGTPGWAAEQKSPGSASSSYWIPQSLGLEKLSEVMESELWLTPSLSPAQAFLGHLQPWGLHRARLRLKGKWDKKGNSGKPEFSLCEGCKSLPVSLLCCWCSLTPALDWRNLQTGFPHIPTTT